MGMTLAGISWGVGTGGRLKYIKEVIDPINKSIIKTFPPYSQHMNSKLVLFTSYFILLGYHIPIAVKSQLHILSESLVNC